MATSIGTGAKFGVSGGSGAPNLDCSDGTGVTSAGFNLLTSSSAARSLGLRPPRLGDSGTSTANWANPNDLLYSLEP